MTKRELLHNLYLKQIKALYEAVEQLPAAKSPEPGRPKNEHAHVPRPPQTMRSVARDRRETPRTGAMGRRG